MDEVQGKHETVGLEERATDIAVHQVHQCALQGHDALLCATPILHQNSFTSIINITLKNAGQRPRESCVETEAADSCATLVLEHISPLP